jgi:hypothetical protein
MLLSIVYMTEDGFATMIPRKEYPMSTLSKSAGEYLRRKSVRLKGRNIRESAAIRYKNQNTPISKSEETPAMPDWLPLTDNGIPRAGNDPTTI